MSKKTGSFTISFEDDLSFVTMRGVIDGPIAKEIMAKTIPFTKSRPYVFSLCDLRELETVTPEARKIFAESANEGEGRGTAMFGASFQTRVIATLVMKAMSLFSKKENPLYFSSTEAEARAWLNERRRAAKLEEKVKHA